MPDVPEVKRQRAHAYNAALRELKRKHRTEWRRIYDRIWEELQTNPVPRVRRGMGWHKVDEEEGDDGLVR